MAASGVIACALVAVIALAASPARASSQAGSSGTRPASLVTRSVLLQRSITSAEAAALARRAIVDDQALDDLRAVTAIDDMPVDLEAVTQDMGSHRAARLDALADRLGASTVTSGNPEEARNTAASVLDQDKFHARDLPKPFRGPLEWVTDQLRPVGRAIDRTAGALVRAVLRLPGGRYIIAGAVLAAVALLASWLARRSNRAAVARSASSFLVDPSDDPAELDRQADAAEAGRRFDEAVRCRYEAGLLRLVRHGRLDLRPDTTAAGAARQIDEAVMDRLTVDFEEIVYGSRAAGLDDATRSRAGWLELLGARSTR